MKSQFLYHLLFASLLVFTGCGTSNKIAALKPPANYSSGQVIYDKQLSFINLPVEVSVADLERQTNKYLNGLVYEDNSLDGDNIMLKVWKQAPIHIVEQGGRLKMELPLKIWTKLRYGIDKFGISAYDEREFNLNGKIRLSTSAGINSWKLSTNTQIEGVDWVESPTVSIAGKAIPITYVINPALSLFKSKIAASVDQAIGQSLDIRPYVLNAVDAMSKPKEVNAEYQAWFAMQPVELYATRTAIANNKLTINLGLKTFLETSVGSKPALTFNKNKLVLKGVDQMPNQFNANLASFTTYQSAAALIQKNFAGQKFESGKRYVVVNKVDLWGKDGKIIVDLGLSGSINGEVYLSGAPVYDPQKKEIFLDQVDFVLDSKSRLLKTADWLVHGMIVKRIAENCRFSIASQLSEGTKSMAAYLNNYSPVKGVRVNGALTELAANKVFLTPNAIVGMITAKGKVSIAINGME